jgi:hypothetical protein
MLLEKKKQEKQKEITVKVNTYNFLNKFQLKFKINKKKNFVTFKIYQKLFFLKYHLIF